VALGLCAILLSIRLLLKGRLYKRISPKSRPRRWVLYSVLVLSTCFAIWFPVWMIWPSALISRLLTLLFGLTFVLALVAFRVFPGFIDAYVQRKGWPLK